MTADEKLCFDTLRVSGLGSPTVDDYGGIRLHPEDLATLIRHVATSCAAIAANPDTCRHPPSDRIESGLLVVAEPDWKPVSQCIAQAIQKAFGINPCQHERLNDHGDACLDCGAVYMAGEGWQ